MAAPFKSGVVLVDVPDQRPVVTSKVCPSHVYVCVRTLLGVVAVSVALTAETSVAFIWATAAPVATSATSADVISANLFMLCRLLVGITQVQTRTLRSPAQ